MEADLSSSLEISFIICTNSSECFQSFLNRFHGLSALMAFNRIELVVVTPVPDVHQKVFRDEALSAPELGDLHVLFVPTLWGSRGTSRNHGYKLARGSWIYFLDQDVWLAQDPLALSRFALALQRIIKSPSTLTKEFTAHAAYSGPYLSEKPCSFWGRSYNWMSTVWLTNSMVGSRVLAGNLLVHKSDLDFCFDSGPFDAKLNDGGEEIAFCESLVSRGRKIGFVADLAVIHKADHSFGHFWRRAYSHAKVKRQLKTPMKKTNLSRHLFKQLVRSPHAWPGLLITLLASLGASLSAPLKTPLRESVKKTNRASGFTLAEVLIAAGLSSLVILLVMSMFYLNIKSYIGMTNRMDSEETLLRVESILKRVARQGLFIQRFNEALPTASQPEGWIRPFDPSVPAPASVAAGAVFQWGLFRREASRGSTSSIKTTGLFYIPPSAAGGKEYEGVLFIDSNDKGDGLVLPSYTNNSFYVGHLSNVTVPDASVVYGYVNNPGGVPTVQRILSVDVQITVRDFSVQAAQNFRCYRSQALCLAANAKAEMGHDKTRTFTILFRDNDFGPSPSDPSVELRGLKSIYFFQDFGRGNYLWH